MAPQDTYLDDEEETCPLCIEEFDLSDKNFRPCPCGYQVCQFCFHNIKSNMNGLCPACRRPYDEKTIQYKVVTAEEQAEFRANLQKSRKKRAELQGQKEVQKRDAEKDARKNLVGIRVVQKNLVYVTGLTPTVREDELLRTLRQPEFFGQYGNIQKISISNRKNQEGQNQSLGIYVTFEKKEDAQRCIQAVNGSKNGDRVLKAQLGTTKYCSAWLRHEQCTNRNCMFLHELGDEEDSYTRQDLSSLNSMQIHRPPGSSGPGSTPAGPSSRSVSRQQVPTQQYQVSQPMARTSSKDGSENGEGPALPASANWARSTQQRSRRGSHATSGEASSPAVSMSLPATTEATEEAVELPPQDESPAPSEPAAAEAATTLPYAQTPQPQDLADAMLKDMLKAMGDCEFKLRPVSPDNTVPPLFDPRGGEKRRAMREEERRLNGEQDEQLELPEPLETGEPLEPLDHAEDEPESGSLALGGEPEDRDHTHEAHVFEQRRVIAQPISRTTTDGLYAQGITSGFTQGAPGLASMGNRAMTPQQQAYLRSQGSFGDNMPPGINASQSALFQGQGHSRQTSRFNFGADTQSSANTMKLAANPRVMAQQASNPAFHSQPGGPYYSGSSLPGPPPGLKPTGTPPNIFGQGGGFGNSGFGAKDNNEAIQNLIRGRSGVGQGHDANKREYMLSHFPHQYPPSTSTPVPATAGFMATLYPQGAYQDIGAKQKKKGKKHRHANTSSSGGSGLVGDLADPSILQVRLQQHHQQSNAGGGLGLFGGQASDEDFEFTPEATIDVDKLVSDDQTDEMIASPLDTMGQFDMPRIPSVPPGLGFIAHGHPPRTSTPSRPPPGLVNQHGTPTTSAVPVAVPVTPLRPALAPVPAESLKSNKKTPGSFAGSDAKKSIKALALESGLAKEITSQSKPAKGKKALLQDEDFPALEATKPMSRTPTPAPSKTPSIKTPMVMKRAQTETPKSIATPVAPETPVDTPSTQKSKGADKKSMPVLNIAAATKAAAAAKKSNPSSAVTSAVEKPDDASFPALPTPSSVSVSSPATRGPKTLRVISTPKTETPPSLPTAAGGPPSLRHTFSGLQRPGTPGSSENVSDSASIISASVSASRTNSPPPNARIGTAAIRSTTKSQQRKARKDVTKKEAAAIASTPKPEPEIEIAPILGRKKKQKKDKPASSKEATPATESRPPSPGPADRSGDKESKPPTGTSTYRQAIVNESISLLDASPGPRSRRMDGNVSSAGEPLKPALDKPVPSPAAVLHEIIKGGDFTDAEAVALLKGISGTSHRSDQQAPVVPKDGLPELKSLITKEDQQALLAGKPVRKAVDGSRVLLTPNGNCVRNLTPAEEERYLHLQADLAAGFDDALAYVHPRHEASNGFSVIRGRAVANGTPPYFPQGSVVKPSSDDQLALPVVDDPMQKMTREEALANINQSILTRFNLGTMNLSSLVESQHASDFHGDAASGTAAPSAQVDAASKNVLKTLEPFFTNLAAATSGHSHSTLDVAPGNEAAFSGLAQTMPPPPALLPTTPAAAFAAGKAMGAASLKGGAGGALAGITSMTLEELESAFSTAKREAEKVEKTLNQVIKKNRRLLSLSSGGAGGGGGH